MDKMQFIKLVSEPEKFSSQDRGWLKAMQAKYPFSSVVGVLAFMADHVHGFDTPNQRRAAVLSMLDKHRLDSLLGKASAAVDDSSFDILSEINTYQEVSFKTAPKSVILSNFLESGPSQEVQNVRSAAEAEMPNEKKSISADEILVTETLALILEKQGKREQAIDAYKKLMLQNPEKSSIFAARIERIKEETNNQ